MKIIISKVIEQLTQLFLKKYNLKVFSQSFFKAVMNRICYNPSIKARKEILVLALISTLSDLQSKKNLTFDELKNILQKAIVYNKIISHDMSYTSEKPNLTSLYLRYVPEPKPNNSIEMSNLKGSDLKESDCLLDEKLVKLFLLEPNDVSWFLLKIDVYSGRGSYGTIGRLGEILKTSLEEINSKEKDQFQKLWVK